MPWEALRELRGLQQLALHDFGVRPGHQPLQRSSRPSTPRSPGYLARDMPQLRALALTGRLHPDLLDRTSVAYAVSGAGGALGGGNGPPLGLPCSLGVLGARGAVCKAACAEHARPVPAAARQRAPVVFAHANPWLV